MPVDKSGARQRRKPRRLISSSEGERNKKLKKIIQDKRIKSVEYSSKNSVQKIRDELNKSKSVDHTKTNDNIENNSRNFPNIPNTNVISQQPDLPRPLSVDSRSNFLKENPLYESIQNGLHDVSNGTMALSDTYSSRTRTPTSENISELPQTAIQPDEMDLPSVSEIVCELPNNFSNEKAVTAAVKDISQSSSNTAKKGVRDHSTKSQGNLSIMDREERVSVNCFSSLMTRMDELEKNIMRKLNKLEDKIEFDIEAAEPEKPDYLPFKNFKEIERFNRINEDKFNKLVKYFRYLGGRNLEDAVKNMFHEAITHECCNEFTMYGTDTAKSLYGTTLFKAIFRGVSRAFQPTKQQFIHVLSERLRSAKQTFRNRTRPKENGPRKRRSRSFAKFPENRSPSRHSRSNSRNPNHSPNNLQLSTGDRSGSHPSHSPSRCSPLNSSSRRSRSRHSSSSKYSRSSSNSRSSHSRSSRYSRLSSHSRSDWDNSSKSGSSISRRNFDSRTRDRRN